MSVYLIATIIPNPEEPEALGEYSSKVGELLVNAGGTEAKRVKVKSSIKGDPLFHLMLFMKFENEKAVRDVFESEAYQQLIPIRDKAFKELSIQVFEDL